MGQFSSHGPWVPDRLGDLYAELIDGVTTPIRHMSDYLPLAPEVMEDQWIRIDFPRSQNVGVVAVFRDRK